MLTVFFKQEIDCCVWDGDFPDGVLRFRSADLQLSFPIPARLLAHGDGTALDVQVGPEQSCQLAFADTRDQFQIKTGFIKLAYIFGTESSIINYNL